MTDQTPSTDSRRCVWMSAGLLTYKLCDRDFDCEHCPLDAALQGVPTLNTPRLALSRPGRGLRVFPEDRRYSPGHCWVQTAHDTRRGDIRLGLDAFAAALIARASAVRWETSRQTLQPGQVAFQIDLDLGVLSVSTPIAGRVRRGNRALEQSPQRLITSPYRDGWVVELSNADPTQLRNLLSSEEVRDQTKLDLRHFRRQLALHLLADASAVGPCLADGGELLSDLRQMLGGRRYLEILRQLVR